MSLFQVLISLLGFSFIFCSTDSLYCGNWAEFGEEKCIKVLDKQNFVDYQNAVELCAKTENSVLLSIHSESEQKFLEKFLFDTNSIVDDVWIGLKNETVFKWSDKTSVDFTNWAKGSPKHIPDRDCVQLLSEDSLNGQWTADSCLKRGLVVCQKSISVSSLKKIVQQLKKESIDKTQQLTDVKKTNENLVINTKAIEKQLENCNKRKSDGILAKLMERKLNVSKPFIENNKSKIIFSTWDKEYNVLGFNDAVKQCEDLGSNLIEIRSESKQKSFDNALTELGLNKYYFQLWLNAKRQTEKHNYHWLSDGQQFNYTNWVIDPTGMNNEPAPYPGLTNVMADYGQNTLDIRELSRTHPDIRFQYKKWKTAYPTHSFYTICEHELS